jgi:hypothetical protein
VVSGVADLTQNVRRRRLPSLALCLTLCLALSPMLSAGCRCGGSGPVRGKRKQPAVVVVDPGEQQAPLPEREPNDDRARAMPLEADTTIRARIASAKDQDWYKVELKGAKPRVLGAKASVQGKLDLVLTAFDAAGKFLVKVDNTGPGEGERLVNLMVPPGTIYLRVSRGGVKRRVKRARRRKGGKGGKGAAKPEAAPPAEQGEYALRFGWRDPEVGEEREPNWKRSLASELKLGEEAVGYLGWRTDTDWYRVALAADVAATDRLRVELDGVDGVWSSLSLYDSRGKLLQRRRGRPGEMVVLPHLLRPAGELIFVVVRCGRTFNAEARYSLRVSAAPPAGTTEIEPNDRIAQATSLEQAQPIKGTLADTYDRDVYALKVTQPGLLQVTATPPLALDLALAVVDAAGKVIREIDDGGPGQPEVLPAFYVRPPLALVRVRARKPRDVDPVGSYRLYARVTAPGASEREPNDTAGTATSWVAGWAEVRGYLHPRKDVDSFVLPAGAPIGTRFILTPPDGVKATLELLVDGKPRAKSTTADASGQLAVVLDDADANKKIMIRIGAASGSSATKPYRLARLTGAVAPPAPGSVGAPTKAGPVVAPKVPGTVAPIAPIAPVAPTPR